MFPFIMLSDICPPSLLMVVPFRSETDVVSHIAGQAVTSEIRSKQENILCITEDKALQPAYDLAPPHPSR